MNLVAEILESANRLPRAVAVFQRVLQLIEDPESSAQDIVEVIQYDPSITANILKMSTSALFGPRREIQSVRDALVRIGFDQLLEVVLSQECSSLFDRSYRGYDLEFGALWRHSVASALLAKIIAGHLKKGNPPQLFTAGLLHDIGKIVLSEFVDEHFDEIKTGLAGGNRAFIEAEKEVLGIHHAELGGRIAETWNFPEAIVAAIRFHHDPLLAPSHHELVSLIYLSDAVALMTGVGGGADGLFSRGYGEVLKQFGLKIRDIEEFILELQTRMAEVESMLEEG
jgi:putative nucleotidyltransferase with HDIG domain